MWWMQTFKEFSGLRHITNFKRIIFPISVAFFIYTFGWGITSPVFSIYVEKVTGNLFLTGVISARQLSSFDEILTMMEKRQILTKPFACGRKGLSFKPNLE